MTPDVLESAAGALRETSEVPSVREGEATIARVLHDVRHRRHQRRRLATAALSLGLVVMGVGAWAATTGRLAVLARGHGPAAAAAPGPSRPARAGAASAGPEIVPLAPAPVTSSPAVTAARPALAAHRRPGAELAVPAATTAPEPARSPDDLYRQAHELHFVRRDFAAALPLWESYLALTPLPSFAVEARYNRAIALYRLGRRDEAAAALRPFADADYGSYRTREARALIDQR